MTILAQEAHPLRLVMLRVKIMNSSSSKGDWVKVQRRKYNQPIDTDSLLWVRNYLMRLEEERRWADRISLFEEFFPNDAMIPRID